MHRLALLLSMLLPALALAQEAPFRDLMHARNYAMGGAYRAHGLGAESASGNPASLALYRRYLVEMSGAYDFATRWGFGTVAVADSATSEVAAGYTYQAISYG